MGARINPKGPEERPPGNRHLLLTKYLTGPLCPVECYRSTSLVRKRTLLGPYRRPMPRALWWPRGGQRFLMNEVPLYSHGARARGYRGTSLIRKRKHP